MQLLLIMLGQRGFNARRMARLQESHDLLDIALRETLASENGTVTRASYNGLSGADLSSELFAWLRLTALPRHFPTVPAVSRLTMLQSYQFRDNVYRNRNEESLVRRVDWKSGLTPSFDGFLSGCSPTPPQAEVVQTFFHLSEAFMDGKTVNRRMSSSFLSLFDREIALYSHSLPDAGSIAVRAAALIICRDDEQANLKQLSKGSGVSAAPGSGVAKALITSGVASDMTKAIKTAGFLAMHEATRPHATPPARNPFAFFAHMFKAVRQGTLVPLQVLATGHVTYGSLHPFFVNLHDLTPYLGTYVGGLLSVDNHGQHLQQMIGYEPPSKLVDKLVKGDLDGLVLFALKEGLLHKKAFAMKAVGSTMYKPVKDLPALDIATLDELDLFMTPLLGGFGFTADGPGSFSAAISDAKTLIRDCPLGFAANAPVKALDYLRTLAREAGKQWTSMLRTSPLQPFDPVLALACPSAAEKLKAFREAIPMLATFNDWGILDNVNKRAKTSGDTRDPPRPGVFGGGAVARPPAPAPAPAPRPGAQQQNLQRVFPPGMQQSDVIAVCPNLQWLERFICTNRP